MATRDGDHASSSTMNQNGDAAGVAGQTQTLVPTLKSIQRDTAVLFEAQQNEIDRLKKQLEDRDMEIIELKTKRMKLVHEKNATDQELRSLKSTIETDGKREVPSRGNAREGLRSDVNDPKDHAAGDGGSRIGDEYDTARLGGQHPVSDQSVPESHSSQVKTDFHKRLGNAAAAASAAVSQGNSYSSLKDESSKMIGASENDKVTLENLDWLAENISVKDWKPLLRKLGVKDGTIDDITHANPSNIREQRYQGFKAWRKISGSEATIFRLLSAMEKESLQQNIREFRDEFKVTRGYVETDSVLQVFSNAFHELMDPFLAKKIDELEDRLRGVRNLSEPQCVKLQYPLNHVTVTKFTPSQGATVLSALEYCSGQILKEHPSDKKGRLLKLQKVLQVCGRDVRAEFKKCVWAGVVGPLNEEKDLRETRADILSKVEEMLSVCYDGTKNWKDLTHWLKKEHKEVFEPVDKYKVDFWEKNKDPRIGASSILQVWMTTTKATEGKLYTWLVHNGRNDIAEFLE